MSYNEFNLGLKQYRMTNYLPNVLLKEECRSGVQWPMRSNELNRLKLEYECLRYKARRLTENALLRSICSLY